MQGQGIDLSGLRDIHLPAIPSVWPLPAIFWIVLLSCFLGAFACYQIWRYIHRITAKKYANREVERIADRFRGNNYKISSEICLLLRRIALMKFKRENISLLSGKDWRQFLEKTTKKTVFAGQAGDIVENIMFIPPNRFRYQDVASLINAAKEWITENT
ncbi:MAG: DUF4381 domain-containing protein [Alphaproteobacteria bacterium]|nr:DUF4381 domain-containing protein [Alphaproteobacteria bacterium]